MLIENGTISPVIFGTGFSADEIFRCLSPAAEKNLRAVTARVKFAADARVVARGQKPKCLYVLRRGSAKIISPDEHETRLLAKNEMVGLTESLSDMPYKISVQTVTPCSFDRLNGGEFLEFLQNEPEVCFRLLQILGTNLQKLFRLLH